jgi:hypothetical protein
MRAYDIDKGSAFPTSRVTVAIVAPTNANDVTQGVSVGDLWVNTALSQAYICTSSTPGAPAWTRFNAA